ncbi:hypothetical protein PINS_up002451 [Pythium insidiosum]|nr:hypothetical protein PINS_up002451 [Pythium insidiosum]
MEDGGCVGISEFLIGPSDKQWRSLGGRIKERPSDFVVREIASDGTVVEWDDSSCDRVPTTAERNAVVDAMKTAKGDARRNERLVFDEPAHGWREELRQQVPAEQLTSLETLMANATEGTDSVDLDAPVEFRDRVFLMVCIQNCFPGLDCKIKKPQSQTESSTQSSDTPDEQKTTIQVSVDGLYRKLRSAGIVEKNCSRLLTYVRNGASDPAASKGVKLEHDDSKEARTALHRQISSATALLRTRTESGHDGPSQLVAYFAPAKSKKRKRTEPEPFVRFVLRKENTEHFSCMESIARTLKMPVSAFAYAGTKDKAAITLQHVTVQGIAPERLLGLHEKEVDGADKSADSGRSASVRIGHLQYVSAPMSLGGSSGNRFQITVRGVKSTETTDADSIEHRVKRLKEQGFINYYGFQRVGMPTSTVRQHHIGQLLVARKWREAVNMLLKPTAQDSPECSRVKTAYHEEGVDAALAALSPGTRGLQVERAVLQGLKRFGSEAFEAAVRCIPYSRRLMYLHAYQSYVFNVMASSRVSRLGHRVVAGDLVRGESADESVVVATAEMAQRMNETHAAPLTMVVLPLAGSSVLFPENEMGKEYATLLAEHGTADHILSASSELKGAYRSLVQVPCDVSWRWASEMESSSREERAVVLEFSLASGSFATMCLRELLRANV